MTRARCARHGKPSLLLNPGEEVCPATRPEVAKLMVMAAMATALALATPPVAPPAPVLPASSSCVCTSTATTCKSGPVTLTEEDCGCQLTSLTDGTVEHWCYVVNPDTCPEAEEARIAARAHVPPTPEGPAAVST